MSHADSTTAARPSAANRRRFYRLDTLEPVRPDLVLWGQPLAVRVRRPALSRLPGPGRVPYLPVSAMWAVRLVDASPRTTSRAARIAFLMARDGDGCLYCGRPIDPKTVHVEHVVSTAKGGPDHEANLALTCGPCNAAAGHLPAAEKLRLAMERRSRDTTRVSRQLAELAQDVLGEGPLGDHASAAVALASALLFGRMRRYREAVEVLELVAPHLCAALGASLPAQYVGPRGEVAR